MEHTTEVTSLAEHDKRSDERAHYLAKKIDKLATTEKEVAKMEVIGQDNTAALIAAMMGGRHDGVSGAGAGLGAGLGGGILGGILGGALIGGNGLGGLGGRNGIGEVVTPALLAASLANVTETQNNTSVMQTLGAIQGSIPLAEGQVQLALAGAQSDLTGLINNANIANLQGQFLINKNVSDTTAQIIATEVATQDVVQNGNAAIQASLTNIATGIVQNTYAVTSAVRDDGDKTRALLIAQNDALLNRQLAVAESALLEQRAIGRTRETEVNVTQTVTQVQAQAQAQQQQQQQLILLSQLVGIVGGLQNAVATNSNLIVGNTGATTTGAQTANPVNVRT